MQPPQLLTDLIRLMLLLAAPASVVCLLLAGLGLRQSGGASAVIGGGTFSKWIFWAILFITLPGLLSWFPSFGVPTQQSSGGIGTGWMANIQTDLQHFVQDFVVARLAVSLAAFYVLRAILETIEGGHPLPCIIAAMFLLSLQTTFNLLTGYNHGGQFATADVLDTLFNYAAGTLCPIAAGLAIAGTVWAIATRRPVLPLVFSTLGLLTVSAIWKLVTSMM